MGGGVWGVLGERGGGGQKISSHILMNYLFGLTLKIWLKSDLWLRLWILSAAWQGTAGQGMGFDWLGFALAEVCQ